MAFDFPRLIAHAAKTRPLGAGTIIGSGTVANADRNVGSSCIAEPRHRNDRSGRAPDPIPRLWRFRQNRDAGRARPV
jgi:2-keto-4-pentenoate hydratase/2-oxohepta-3-ene-1,7-dioic acid hydratase in catechol pathway